MPAPAPAPAPARVTTHVTPTCDEAAHEGDRLAHKRTQRGVCALHGAEEGGAPAAVSGSGSWGEGGRGDGCGCGRGWVCTTLGAEEARCGVRVCSQHAHAALSSPIAPDRHMPPSMSRDATRAPPPWRGAAEGRAHRRHARHATHRRRRRTPAPRSDPLAHAAAQGPMRRCRVVAVRDTASLARHGWGVIRTARAEYFPCLHEQPQSHRPVVAARRQPQPVGADAHGVHRIAVPLERLDARPRLNVPQPHRLIVD